MTTRKNTFLIKRSNVPGKVPSPGDLQLGELALNTADVILYASGTTANQILPIGWDRLSTLSGGTVNGNIISTGYFSGTTYYGDGSNLTGISDYYVTGGTFSSGTLTLNRNGLSDVTITGFTSGSGSGTLTGSGITNKVAFWNDETGLSANTNFHWDNTNERLGVGIGSPTAKIHINNTASTDSFLVEDSVNPDTSPFVIDQSGNVGIGTTAPSNLLEVNSGNLLVWRFAINPNVIQRRSDGSSGSETTLSAEDIIGYNNFQAFQSSGLWPNVGRVGVLADANHSSISMPTRLSFWTTPSGSTIVTERMRIDNQGNVGIGLTSPSEKLVVSGNSITTGTISGTTLVITSTPTLNNTNTDFLTRNTSTGNIEYSTPASAVFYAYGVGFAQSIGNYLT